MSTSKAHWLAAKTTLLARVDAKFARNETGVRGGALALPVASFRNTCNLSHCNPARALARKRMLRCARWNRRFTRGLAMAASVATIALLGYFLFPGHTYLQAGHLLITSHH